MRRLLFLLPLLLLLFFRPVHAEDYRLTIESCGIANGNVYVRAAGSAETDDGYLYLCKKECYQKTSYNNSLKKIQCVNNPTFVTTLDLPGDLYRQYYICGYIDGTYKRISNYHYITNPGTIAEYTIPRFNNSKKGVLPSAALMQDLTLLDELKVSQVAYNIMLGDLLSDGDIKYRYRGYDYYFNSSILGQYDSVLSRMENRNIQVTMILLNNKGKDDVLIHPLVRNETANYYAFNTMDRDGVETMQAVAAFLAERYSGGQYGTVDNWIIANEVNSYKIWYRYPDSDMVTPFVTDYANAFRIFYNAIKSVNANARVYISLDNQWTRHNDDSYTSKEVLDKFATIINTEGNINWGLAIHPYNMPLTSTDVKGMDGVRGITHDASTAYMTMQNIDALTDYMHRKEMLTGKGNVRSILCSEQGYTSSGPGGEAAQAQAIVYAYQIANKNEDIDGFILNRQQDAPEEVKDGLALGLMDSNGNKKMSYQWYADADSEAILSKLP